MQFHSKIYPMMLKLDFRSTCKIIMLVFTFIDSVSYFIEAPERRDGVGLFGSQR